MKKRLICIVALLLISSLLLCSCSTYKQLEPDADDLTVVGQVNGKDVYLDELRFAAFTCRDQLVATYGEDIFKGDDAQKYFDMLCDMVYSNITSDYATLLLCEESLISLGEVAIVERVDAKMQELVDELGGMSKYKKYLKENHLTDRLLRFSTEISLLQNELLYVYIDDLYLIENDDDKVYEIIKDEFIVVRHVFVSRENHANIVAASSELSAGADFMTVMQKYNEDKGSTATGEFILKGYMTPSYEQAAFALGVGERSDIIEDGNGYYIIERLEMQVSSIMLQFDHLKQMYQTYTFYSMLDKKQEALSFIPNQQAEDFMKNTFLS